MTLQSNSQQALRHICQRIASLENDRAELADEIKQAKSAAKSDGFDPKLITKTVRLMRMDADKLNKEREQQDLLEVYMHAVGLLGDGATKADQTTDDGSEE